MTNQMVLRPQTFDQLTIFAEMAARSTLVPGDYKGNPGNIMVAVQMGSEIGLAPMQALQNIAVINGRPAVFGDAMLALCKNSPLWGGIKESVSGTGDAMVATCEIHRKDDNPVVVTFSVENAKKAELWGKRGPWQQYPQRMLQMRARGFALRDAFPDVLKGLISADEAQDIPADTFKGTTIQGHATPAQVERTNTPEPHKQTPMERGQQLLSEIGAVETEDALESLYARVSAAIEYLNGRGQAELADEIANEYLLQKQRLAGEEAAA